jgi:tRNA (pseudouridine54-N1)-methyltransferase
MPSKKFALIGHRVPSHGKLNLNDLAGSCGRLDVLLRSVNTSLFLSHGIREDVEVILHLQGGEKPPRRIWIDGSKAKGVHSDERSIAGHLSKILQKPLPPIGTKKEISNGFYHGQGTLTETLLEWKNTGISPYHLDINGININSKLDYENEIGFIISDDQPFNEKELEILSEVEKISVGEKWIQGHSVIAILHHYLD